jgi:quercetin dioxygenase-like cupin family protein
MYTHSSDQVLVVTEGTGIIATETDQEVITVGGIVHIPAEERHWRGASPHSAISHMALTAKGSQTTQRETTEPDDAEEKICFILPLVLVRLPLHLLMSQHRSLSS